MNKRTAIYVEIKPNEPAERALKKFKRLCEKFGVKREYKKRQEYKKPSIRLAERKAESERRRAKERRKQNRNYKRL